MSDDTRTDRQTHRHTDTDTQTHRQTQTDFIICPIAISYSYGTDKNADKTCKNKSRQSEQVLKVSSVSFHTGAQPYAPLVNGLVDD